MKTSKRKYIINYNLDNSKLSDLIVTDICNMNCPFCIASYMINTEHQYLTIDMLENTIIPLYKSKGITHVGISGGEPSIHPELPQICKILKENGFQINIASNGANKEILKQCDPYINYISLSLNNHNYNEINNFDDQLSCQLRVHGLIYKNHYDNIDKIKTLCEKLNDDIIIDSIFITRFIT